MKSVACVSFISSYLLVWLVEAAPSKERDSFGSISCSQSKVLNLHETIHMEQTSPPHKYENFDTCLMKVRTTETRAYRFNTTVPCQTRSMQVYVQSEQRELLTSESNRQHYVVCGQTISSSSTQSCSNCQKRNSQIESSYVFTATGNVYILSNTANRYQISITVESTGEY